MTSGTAGKAIDGGRQHLRGGHSTFKFSVCGVFITRPWHINAGTPRRLQSRPTSVQHRSVRLRSQLRSQTHSTGSANTGHVMVIVIVINKTHSIIHSVFAWCFDSVFGLLSHLDPRWDPCILAPIRADPGMHIFCGWDQDPSEFWNSDLIPPTCQATGCPGISGLLSWCDRLARYLSASKNKHIIVPWAVCASPIVSMC